MNIKNYWTSIPLVNPGECEERRKKRQSGCPDSRFPGARTSCAFGVQIRF